MEFLGTKKRRFVNPRAVFPAENPEPVLSNSAMRPHCCPGEVDWWPPDGGNHGLTAPARQGGLPPERGLQLEQDKAS